jgi:hypothetical protein
VPLPASSAAPAPSQAARGAHVVLRLREAQQAVLRLAAHVHLQVPRVQRGEPLSVLAPLRVEESRHRAELQAQQTGPVVWGFIFGSPVLVSRRRASSVERRALERRLDGARGERLSHLRDGLDPARGGVDVPRGRAFAVLDVSRPVRVGGTRRALRIGLARSRRALPLGLAAQVREDRRGVPAPRALRVRRERRRARLARLALLHHLLLEPTVRLEERLGGKPHLGVGGGCGGRAARLRVQRLAALASRRVQTRLVLPPLRFERLRVLGSLHGEPRVELRLLVPPLALARQVSLAALRFARRLGSARVQLQPRLALGEPQDRRRLRVALLGVHLLLAERLPLRLQTAVLAALRVREPRRLRRIRSRGVRVRSGSAVRGMNRRPVAPARVRRRPFPNRETSRGARRQKLPRNALDVVARLSRRRKTEGEAHSFIDADGDRRRRRDRRRLERTRRVALRGPFPRRRRLGETARRHPERTASHFLGFARGGKRRRALFVGRVFSASLAVSSVSSVSSVARLDGPLARPAMHLRPRRGRRGRGRVGSEALAPGEVQEGAHLGQVRFSRRAHRLELEPHAPHRAAQIGGVDRFQFRFRVRLRVSAGVVYAWKRGTERVERDVHGRARAHEASFAAFARGFLGGFVFQPRR